jgi:FkbM family methyltransferase
VAGRQLTSRLRPWASFWGPLGGLAPGPFATVLFWATLAELTARQKLGRALRRPRRVRLLANGVLVAFALADLGELHGLREVFVQHDYALDLPRDPRVILDLGGNIGAAAVYFATRWPDAAIVVLEPDPSAFERLARNVEPFTRVQPLQLAAAAQGGEVSLYRSDWTLTNSLIHDPASETVQVTAVSLDWLVKGPCGGAVDLVKLDIEGSEYELMRAYEGRGRILALVGELHEAAMGASVDEFASLLPDHQVELERLPNGEHSFRAWLGNAAG